MFSLQAGKQEFMIWAITPPWQTTMLLPSGFSSSLCLSSKPENPAATLALKSLRLSARTGSHALLIAEPALISLIIHQLLIGFHLKLAEIVFSQLRLRLMLPAAVNQKKGLLRPQQARRVQLCAIRFGINAGKGEVDDPVHPFIAQRQICAAVINSRFNRFCYSVSYQMYSAHYFIF
jgi:hypothetical protein